MLYTNKVTMLLLVDKELLKQPTDKPYSIVLDLDETVLDNVPYQV